MSEKKIDDGGPAFPQSVSIATDDAGHIHTLDSQDRCLGGMSLRDWFAGQVRQDEIDTYSPVSRNECAKFLGMGEEDYSKNPLENYARITSRIRYTVADAMLAARKEVTP